MEERNLINGYYLLEQDLKEVFSFVEPVSQNYSTYSHRLYSLFIRGCTEFEANCKSILEENNEKVPANQNINYYCRIHDYDKYRTTNDYIVKLQWASEIDLLPLAEWQSDKSPVWYKAYNDVKHSRVKEFNKATLGNVLNAVAAVYILLYASYTKNALNQLQDTELSHENEGWVWKESSLFKIKPG